MSTNKFTIIFSRIGNWIGLSGGWKHLRGEGEGCDLDFWTNVCENRVNATLCPGGSRILWHAYPSGLSLMVRCRNTSMKPERATRNLCRKERFIIHNLTCGRDPNPGFRVLREQWNSQPAEVNQFSKKKKNLQQLTRRTQRLATSNWFQDTNTTFLSRVAWLPFGQIAEQSTKPNDTAWLFGGGRMRVWGERDQLITKELFLHN